MTFAPDQETGDLEAGIGRWQAGFGDISSSSLQAHAGSKSLRILSTGGDTLLYAETDPPPSGSPLPAVGSPATSVVIDGWAFTEDPIFETFEMNYQFYNSLGVGQSSSSTETPVVLGEWVHLVGNPTVVGSGVYLKVVVHAYTSGGATVGGEDVFWDDFHYTYRRPPLRKRQLGSREFTIRRGPQGY